MVLSTSCKSNNKATSGRPRRDRSELLRTLPPCRVCKEAASGFHYGVNTCEACKGFFRRALKHGSTFTCKFNQSCNVTGTARTLCSFCRFQRCLAVGMSTNAIKVGRYTHEARTRNIIEVKFLAKQKEGDHHVTETPPLIWPHGEDATSRPDASHHGTLTGVDLGPAEHRRREQSQGCARGQPEITRSPSYLSGVPLEPGVPGSAAYKCEHPVSFLEAESTVDYTNCKQTYFMEDSGYSQNSELSFLEELGQGHGTQEYTNNSVFPENGSYSYISCQGDGMTPFCYGEDYKFAHDFQETFLYNQTMKCDFPTPDLYESAPCSDSKHFPSHPPSCVRQRSSSPALLSRMEQLLKETSVYNGDVLLKEHVAVMMQFQQENARKSTGSLLKRSSGVTDDLDAVITRLVESHDRLILVSTYFPDDFISDKLKSHSKLCSMREHVIGQLPELSDEQYLDMYKSTGIDMDGRVNNMKVNIGYFESFLRSLIKFAKSLPGFKALPLDDQTQLLKASYADFWFLGTYRGYNSDLNSVIMPNGHCFHRNDLYKTFDRKWVDSSFQLAEVFQRRPIDPHQLVIVKSLLLTLTDRCTVLNPRAVEDIQDLLLACLRRQLSVTSAGHALSHLIGESLNKLTLIRPLSSLDKQNLQKRIFVEHMTGRPLIREMLSSV
ncbi:unnamed protein product [Lymnaea stagnalis]|uniref:Uncharacterized protein n=1 Tax=Lymnaea stagnalis TaxID=6523 RepID=A0AAV2IKC7_LYMST